MGLFIHNPSIDLRQIGTLNENSILHRYGLPLHNGLVTFSRLSEAEKGYLIIHLQR